MRVALLTVAGVLAVLGGLLVAMGWYFSYFGVMFIDAATVFAACGVLCGRPPHTRARAVLSALIFAVGAALSYRLGLRKMGRLDPTWRAIAIVQAAFALVALATTAKGRPATKRKEWWEEPD